jgi:hypothetical protein
MPFCDRCSRRVCHRGPMLFRNPFPMHLYSFHRCAAKLAGMHSPLLSISVSGKNCLQVITEPAVTRLYGYWHHSPIHRFRCGKPELSSELRTGWVNESWKTGFLALIPGILPPMRKLLVDQQRSVFHPTVRQVPRCHLAG